MDDAVHLILLQQLEHAVEVADVGLDEDVIGPILNVFQVGQIAGIREFVEVDNAVVGVLVHEKAYHVAADESGSAGNQNAVLIIHS